MNIWTKKSIELANQTDYLDNLYKVYPMSNNLKRELDEKTKEEIEKHLQARDNESLVNTLISQDLFPIKDSYVAYLRRDKAAIKRNPKTIARVSGILYEMGYDEIIKNMTLPKETNRQIGPMFKNWLRSKSLGIELVRDEKEFLNSKVDCLLDMSDGGLESFAKEHLGYAHNKGLDFIAKFSGKYILGEAKFLTDFGGHQNAQFADALAILRSPLQKTQHEVKTIAVLDGVLYIPTKNKLFTSINQTDEDEVIISALLLRDYLYSI